MTAEECKAIERRSPLTQASVNAISITACTKLVDTFALPLLFPNKTSLQLVYLGQPAQIFEVLAWTEPRLYQKSWP